MICLKVQAILQEWADFLPGGSATKEATPASKGWVHKNMISIPEEGGLEDASSFLSSGPTWVIVRGTSLQTV